MNDFGITTTPYAAATNSSNIYTGITTPSLRESCISLYKQVLFYNVTHHYKDLFTEENHKNMTAMLNSNDNETLELLRQILVSKIID